MATHPAITATGLTQPLTIAHVPTPTTQRGEVRIRVEWVPSAPLDVFQVDAGLMAQYPQSLGDTAAGTIVEVGLDVKHYRVGDRVFGFFFHGEKEKAQQVYVTVPEHLFAKVPEGVSLAAAATLPNNFCTAFFTLCEKLRVELPWPLMEKFSSKTQDMPILIWGASSSVGQYAVQILKHWGYTNVIATASPKHHDKIRSYGAKHVLDYRDPCAVDSVIELLNAKNPLSGIRVFDCVSSKFGSLLQISKIAVQPGSIVAALLPVVVSASSAQSSGVALQLASDVSKEAVWTPDVEVHGVSTYSYEANAFLRDNLQPVIMPTLLAEGAIKPNKQRVISGNTLLERAQTALDIMRSGAVSGERLVWKVWTAEEFPQFRISTDATD